MGAGTRVPRVQEELQKFIGRYVFHLSAEFWLYEPKNNIWVWSLLIHVFSKELGRFLNTDEAIAMGALFQVNYSPSLFRQFYLGGFFEAAHLSKGFKVKPFGVEELVIFPIQVSS